MKKLNFIFVLLLLTLAIRPIFSQNLISMKSSSNQKDDLRLSDLEITVSITGNIATTNCFMTFENSTTRILEVEFEFPLDQNQTISGYALDINGKMRQGVVVEKDKGREVFETIVRQNIDPGLVEMTNGNNFKTRVYPIPAKGSRKVLISYEQELNIQNGVALYTLNPLTKDVLDTFKFSINVSDGKIEKNNSKINWQKGYNANITEKNYIFDTPISIEIPFDTKKDTVFTETQGKDTYFYYFTQIDSKPVQKKMPSKITIFYDVSDSRKNCNKEKELALLDEYLSKANAKVTILTFANEIIETKTFGKNKKNEVLDYIDSLVFDGGSAIKEINFSKNDHSADEILLFSDGINTWNMNESETNLNKMCPITTINSSFSADHAFLGNLARKTGGVYINLTATNQTQALNLLTTQTLRLINLKYDGAKIQEIYPLIGAQVNETFSVCGMLNKKDATLEFSFGYGNKVTQTKKINVSIVDSVEANNVRRIWAQKKIAELSMDYDKNKDEIISLAKKFNIVTKDTSLIVLDNVYDYVKYEITPPDELKEEYQRLIRNRNTTKVEKDESIPKSVYKNFEEFKKWWNTDPSDFKKQKKKRDKILYNTPFVTAESASSTPFDEAENASDLLQEFHDVIDEISIEERVYNSSVQDNFFASPQPNSLKSSQGFVTSAPKAASSSSGNRNQNSSIALQAWSSNSDYIKELKRCKTEKMYEKYIELKAQNSASPAFYMEVADYFFEEEMPKEAMRILSNLSELELENSDILRALGNKLVEHKDYENATWVFQKLTELRPEIPQFYRDLALAFQYSGEIQKAVDTLYYVASRSWDSRFEGIQQIALNDMNALIATMGKKEKIDTQNFDEKLLENFPVDMRVVLTWNTDNCDIDLWVTDPSNEKCYYGNKLTQTGGRMSRDFTRGYGPEEFCIKEAPNGKYKIEVNYYGTSSQKLLQPVIIQAEVFTNFGKANQERQVLTLQLDSIKGVFAIGTIEFEK